LRPPLVCLSHLRWDFVTQRPNHLMTRAARDRAVFFVEEPLPVAGRPELRFAERGNVMVVTPLVPEGRPADPILRDLAAELVRDFVEPPWLWYYTPAAGPWTDTLAASAVVYDCMDDLKAFRGAPPELAAQERQLFLRADIVFTGGHALYERICDRHPSVHPFPSGVDVEHFRRARRPQPEPPDQAAIPHPRIGWFGVIDERFDRELLAEVAAARPEWQFVLVGPVAKLAPEEEPAGPNIHRLGPKPYEELPAYLAGWDVAMMPFARNASTATISPTKTPEYLAGGRPVVGTPIRDVVEPYGRLGLVQIAGDAEGFVRGIEAALAEDREDLVRRAAPVLARGSWDSIWAEMDRLVTLVTEPVDARRPTARLHLATSS